MSRVWRMPRSLQQLIINNSLLGVVVGGPLQGICLPYPLYPKGITADMVGKIYAVPIIFTGSTCCPIFFRQYGMPYHQKKKQTHLWLFHSHTVHDIMNNKKVVTFTASTFVIGIKVGCVLWCLMPLSTIFQLYHYIMAVSFIGGGYRSAQRKPLTCRKWQKT